MNDRTTDAVAVDLDDSGVATIEMCRPPNNYIDTSVVAAIADAWSVSTRSTTLESSCCAHRESTSVLVRRWGRAVPRRRRRLSDISTTRRSGSFGANFRSSPRCKGRRSVAAWASPWLRTSVSVDRA